MSIYHATTDAGDDFTPASLRAPLNVLATLANAARPIIAGLRATIERRLAMQRISRMSDHMLADFGFERDWDGTIRSNRDADTGAR